MDYKNRDITLARIGVTTGWAGFNPKGNVAPGRMDQNLCGRLWSRHDRNAVKISVAKTEGALVRPSREALESLDYRPAAIGEQFGPTWATFVFRLDITVPPCFQGCDVNLLWDSNSEALVMNADGVPRQGLVGGDHHCRRADFPLLSRAGGGETDTLYVEIACNGLFGAGRGGDIEPPDPDKFYKLEECCIAIFDAEAWSLLHDLTCLEGLAKDLPEGPRREQALHTANDVINAIVVQDRSTYAAGRACAAKFFVGTSGLHAPVVHSILHSHIDLAWLWPASATPAKAARTFSTQLRLLEQFPEIIYVQSQAQLWSWCKTRYPSLFEEMKVHAKGGRFLPVGGTWVEMDTNLPSGEALIRQFTMGQAWFEKNLGVRCDTMWLPDTFGYACQLPQLMNGCGIKYFLTNKLSWNSWNKFPHSTFVWEGLDGSEVLAHMPPAETYNAQAFPGEVVRSVKDNKDSGVLPRSMMLIGHGDGGGGASPAMLESLTRLRDVGGLGKASPSTVTEFFEEAEKVRARLPRVSGELYFELHRGTFTSQAKTKRLNRECECLLGIVECLSTFAMLLAPSMSVVYTYPSAELKLAWRMVLTNAFHDTLPGTCIKAGAYFHSLALRSSALITVP
jgi:alpha-mannosidase